MTKVEKLADSELSYKLEVEIPLDQVQEAYNKHLSKIAATVDLKGFRKGKVPTEVVEKKFGKGLCQEVATQLIQDSLEKSLVEHDLMVAGQPKIEVNELNKDQPYHYTASFEVYPSIELASMEGAQIEKKQVEITEQDISKMLAKIQQQQATWEQTQAAAEDGYQVNIDFEGLLNNEPFEGGSAQNFDLVLGSGQFIAGFEEALVGVKENDSKDIDLTFPESYPVQDLAGKEVVFKVKVNKVEKPILPELNDDFAIKSEFEGGLEAMKVEVRNNMRRALDETLHNHFKTEVLEVLLAKNPLVITNALVDIEIDHMQKMAMQQMAAQQGKKELPKIDLPRDPYVNEATKRVKLGLLLAEVIKANDIKLDPAAVRSRVEQMASAYKEKEQVISWYYNNKNIMAEVEASVLEDQAIEYLVKNVTINELPVTYDQVMNDNK